MEKFDEYQQHGNPDISLLTNPLGKIPENEIGDFTGCVRIGFFTGGLYVDGGYTEKSLFAGMVRLAEADTMVAYATRIAFIASDNSAKILDAARAAGDDDKGAALKDVVLAEIEQMPDDNPRKAKLLAFAKRLFRDFDKVSSVGSNDDYGCDCPACRLRRLLTEIMQYANR